MIQTWTLPSREIWLMWLFETMYSLCVCFTYICMRIAFIRDPVSPGLLSHQRCLHSLAKGPKFKTICMHTLCYGMLCQIYMQCIAIPTPSSHTYAWRTRGRRALSIRNPRAVTGNCHHLIFVICILLGWKILGVWWLPKHSNCQIFWVWLVFFCWFVCLFWWLPKRSNCSNHWAWLAFFVCFYGCPSASFVQYSDSG